MSLNVDRMFPGCSDSFKATIKMSTLITVLSRKLQNMSQTNAHCEKEILVAHLLNTSSGVIHVTETSLHFLREKILISITCLL